MSEALVSPFEMLAPWDGNAYFATPVETNIAGAATNVQAVPANPNRVGLIFSLVANISSVINIAIGNPGAGGFIINQQAPFIILTHAQLGPYVAQQFFCTIPAGQSLHVTEILLNTWPTNDPNNGKTARFQFNARPSND